MNDFELVQDFVRNGSQGAFTRLVERHVNLVYSAAFRLVRDTHLAEDVTQQVFTLLARKAGRLDGKTILSAWVYRAARYVAAETLRREIRWRRRQQLAIETMSQSAPAEAWPQIEPLLDEAMANLSAADHDALVLRYFESRTLKEVGAALGSSEDAAQKRIARALDRLRANLARRGVTMSATALAATVTGAAVQSAPAGLAASAAAGSLAAAAGAGFSSGFLPALTATNAKFIAAAALIATLSVSLLLLLHQNSALRRQIADSRASAPKTITPPANDRAAAQPAVSDDELRRLRREHLEVLSLRGRVALLANELRQRKAAGSPDTAGVVPSFEETERDSILFTASVTNRVANGHTLVVGGWSAAGMRRYLLLTPAVPPGEATPDGRQLTIHGQVVLAPETFWDEIGWAAYKSDHRRSALAGVIAPEELGALLQSLKETKDAEISASPAPATGPDGRRIGFAFSIEDEQGVGVLMDLDVYPRSTLDGKFVDLELRPSPSSPSSPIPVHHSLVNQATGSAPP